MTPNNNDKPSFMDKNTVLAFALIMMVWFGWQAYEAKYNPPATPAVAAENAAVGTPGAATEQAANSGGGNTASPIAEPSAKSANAIAAASANESYVDFDDSNWSLQISSKGMGVKNVDIKAYKTRDDKPIVLAKMAADYPFSTALHGSTTPVDFTIDKKDAKTFVGHANVDGNIIEKTMTINSDKYTIDVVVAVTQVAPGFTGLTTALSDTMLPTPPSGFLNRGAAADHHDWFVEHDGTKKREVVNKEKGVNVDIANISVAALSEHYFATAVVDHSDILPKFESKIAAGADKAIGHLIYQPTSHPTTFTQKYLAFAGPKNFTLLASVDEGLAHVVDYGMFSFFAKPILWLLKWLYAIIGNWGWSIIILTIVVRFIVMPFNIFSYKSMKVMQKIQPEMNRVRERYKDKPAVQKVQMNAEIMELMKRNKANPLGGCLPMLIQLPVFIALYAVLGQSIELYRAPFLYLTDLSMRDPLYIMPVLMGITMFVNQKITPSTMDPSQAKIMMWMPVIFAFFMISLPSGLTLYIFISTLFGIIQQMIFMRDRGTVQTINAAKA